MHSSPAQQCKPFTISQLQLLIWRGRCAHSRGCPVFLSETVSSESLAIHFEGASGGVEMLNQENLVALLVVKQLIDKFLGH